MKRNKKSQEKKAIQRLFERRIRIIDSNEGDCIFLSTNSLEEKKIFEIKTEGNIFKVVTQNKEKKIVARINDALYNFPIIIAEPGSREKILKAYEELREDKKELELQN
jgi:hypothetical protein